MPSAFLPTLAFLTLTNSSLYLSTAVGIHMTRLYLDRGFDNNGVVAFLETQPFPSIIPLTIRGQAGGTRALCRGGAVHGLATRAKARPTANRPSLFTSFANIVLGAISGMASSALPT